MANDTSPYRIYKQEVTPRIYCLGTAYLNGGEVWHITCNPIEIEYKIDIVHEKWGISDILFWDIKGPSEIEFEVTCEGMADDRDSIELILPIDWSKREVEYSNDKGQFSIEDVEIEFGPDWGDMNFSKILTGQKPGLKLRLITVEVNTY